jgi:ribulose-5-phosphate 4-epimerase/fuculose-1-phosphate aldolase
MYERKLIGIVETPDGWVGYGNISMRWGDGFAITGSQTGELAALTGAHYALVTEAIPQENKVVSRGPIKPSSESLTHAVLYQLDESIQWVMHAHHAPIWQAAKRLGLPQTAPEVPYGTPEMAAETDRLFRETDVRQIGMFAMSGHEDGIVSFGESAEKTAAVMEQYLRMVGE